MNLQTMRQRLHQQKLSSTLLVLGTLTIGILIGTVLNTEWGEAAAQTAATDATPLTLPAVRSLGNEFSQLAKNLEESVVAVHVEVSGSDQEIALSGPPAPDDQGDDSELGDLFRRLIPNGPGGGEEPPRGPQTRSASGTGFIVDKNGYIMTNNHVVENAVKITVLLDKDPTEYRARVIGTDFESDLAVIKISVPRPLKPVTIANSDSVQVGDWAVAIGSPFGLTSSVTAGIVSAIGRGPDQLRDAARPFQSFIQTDAAINPGNSGGPLLNIRGEVIGINSMIETATGGSNGVGFAVPINMGVRVYNDIIRDGKVTRGSIGVNLGSSEHHETLLRAYGLDHGALIDAVAPDSPAMRGGIKSGDVVMAINAKAVLNNQDLVGRVADLPVGKPAAFSVNRGGKAVELSVNIQNRAELYKDNPDIVGSARRSLEPLDTKTSSTTGVLFGFEPRSATDAEKKQIKAEHGVVVNRVVDDSVAADLGLVADDIIESINRQPVDSKEDINRIRGTLKPGDAVAFHVYRRLSSQGGGRGNGARQTETRSIYLAGTLPGR